MTPPHIPEGLQPYRRTSTFVLDTVPQALLREHDTAPGVWGRLVVEAGEVRLWFADSPGRSVVVRGGDESVIAPQRKHRVTLSEDARFFVEFYRGPAELEPSWDDD